MIKLSTQRIHTFSHTDEDSELTFTFDFPFSEETDYGRIRELLEHGTESEIEIVNKETGKTEMKTTKGEMNALVYSLRNALVGQTGIVDENEVPYVIKNEDGSINEHVQCCIFEYIKKQSDLYVKIITTFNGLSTKN